jgi:hypothetical protein
MIKIYCIEDINDNKYIGSTNHKYLSSRLAEHRYRKNCSATKLNLYNCIIYTLEECEDKDRKEREQYWIDNTNCVNINNIVHDYKEYNRRYFLENKDKRYEYYKNQRKINNSVYDFINILNCY